MSVYSPPLSQSLVNMTALTSDYGQEQKILNAIYIGIVSIETAMVLGVAIMGLVKRVKMHRRLKSI